MQAADHATANHMVNKRLAAGIQMRRIFMAVENAHARAAVALRAPEGSVRSLRSEVRCTVAVVRQCRGPGCEAGTRQVGTIGANCVCGGRVRAAG